MSEIYQESWTFGSSLTVENPTVGRFINTGLYTGIELRKPQQNWLICAVPAPDGRAGWSIKSVTIQYNIRNTEGSFGKIDKIGIRDGSREIHGFLNLNLTRNTIWELRTFYVPHIAPYESGLGVTIHVDYGQTGNSPTQFLFTSIGLGFSKPA